MLAALGFIRRELGIGFHDPHAIRTRRCIPGVFGDLAPPAELVRTLELGSAAMPSSSTSVDWPR
jgi:hypothetical protein